MSHLPTSDCMTARAVVRRCGPGEPVEIELLEEPRCRGCEGVCLWRRLPSGKRVQLGASDGFFVGDPVLVSVPGRYVLLGALLLYGLPLAAILAGALVGAALGGADLGVLAGVASGIVVALLAAPRLRRRLEVIMAAQIKLHASA